MDSEIQAQTSGQDMCRSETVGKSCCKNTALKPLSLLAGAALAPLCGDDTHCSCTYDTCCWPDPNLLSLNLLLHFFIDKADNIQRNLLEVVSNKEFYFASVASFLFTCQPYLNHLELTARGSLHENHPSTRSQLIGFSQTLCNKLENLVVTCASKDLLSLDETEPQSISHFHIGQFWLGRLRVTIFRYCQPTPYLAEVNTGLNKRMRWNVERLGEMESDNTEYYFLCCEDVEILPEGDCHSISHGTLVRMWSIGQWSQASPETDDINDWILCKIPQGTYIKKVILGSEEPSCHVATDCLLQLLMFDQEQERVN